MERKAQNITAWTKSENLNGCTIPGIVEVKVLREVFTDYRLGNADNSSLVVLAPDGNEYSVIRTLLHSDKELNKSVSATPTANPVGQTTRQYVINYKGNRRQVSAAMETYDYTGKQETTVRITSNGTWSDTDEIVPESAYTWYTRTDEYEKLEETLYTYEDGHTETRGGEYKQFIIPDAKMKLIEKLKKALNACTEAGIKLNYDNEGGDIYAYYDPNNISSVEEIYRDNENVLPTRVFTSVAYICSTNSDWGPVMNASEE